MKKIVQYKLTILVSIGILIAILMPGSDVPSVGIPNIDKVIHFGMFGMLTLCFLIEYHRLYLKLPKWYVGMIGPIIFGGLTEIMQLYVPGRSCDIKYLLCDSLGVVIMFVCISYYERHKKNN